MTQPDEFHPEGAANFDSFAGFANTTEAEWQSQIDGSVTGIDPLSGICALFSQVPFLDGLASFGGYGGDEDVGIASGVVNGIQLMADGVCGLLTGNIGLGGTTPDSAFGGFGDILDLFFENPFTLLLVELIDETGNLIFDIFAGLLEFVGKLLGLLGADDDSPLGILSFFTDIIGRFFGIFDIFGGLFGGGGSDEPTLNGVLVRFGDFAGRLVDFGFGLLGGLFDIFTGGSGTTGRSTSILDMLFAGNSTLGALVTPESAIGAPGTRAGEIVTRLDALQPNTGAVKGSKISGTVPLGAATAVAGSAVGGKGTAGSTARRVSNALANPTFDGDYALQAAGGWSSSGGKGALG